MLAFTWLKTAERPVSVPAFTSRAIRYRDRHPGLNAATHALFTQSTVNPLVPRPHVGVG